MITGLSKLFRLPLYVKDGILYHLSGFLYTPKPRSVQFPVNDRCDARCIMCNRWRKKGGKEIDIAKIREVFSNSLFSKVEEVNLHGGEPTLREDLAEICRIIQDSCPKLKRVWISTNGLNTKRIERRVREVLDVVDFDRIDVLSVNVSIDGLEETHDRIRGVKGGFKGAVETIKMLKRLQMNYPLQPSMGTVIQPLNLHEVDKLEALAEDLGVPILFQPLMFDTFFNIDDASLLKFTAADLEDYRELIRRKFSNGFSATSFYWHDFLAMMDGARRSTPCAFDRYVFSLYPTGEVLPCSREDWILFGNVYEKPVDEIWFSREAKKIRQRMRREVCPRCSSYCMTEYSIKKEFFAYLRYCLGKVFSGTYRRPGG